MPLPLPLQHPQLIARGPLLDRVENQTCPDVSFNEVPQENFVGSLSFHQFNIILSGACCAASSLVILVLMFQHATHFSKPNEQLKILRICLLIPIYGVISLLTVAFPEICVYIDPYADFYQGIAIVNFFLLLCEFVHQDDSQRELFFVAFTIEGKQAKKRKDALEWYRTRWILIFQYIPVAFIVAVGSDIAQAAGRYCEFAFRITYAHVWFQIILNISEFICIIAVVRFYQGLRKHLAHHKPLAKLLAFKLIVFLTFVQRIIQDILKGAGALDGTSTLTWADLNIGVWQMLTLIEMVFFSLFFHYAYGYRPYVLKNPTTVTGKHGQQYTFENKYQGGPLGVRAFISMLSPMELFRGFAFAFKMKSAARHGVAPGTNHSRYSVVAGGDQSQTLLSPQRVDQSFTAKTDYPAVSPAVSNCTTYRMESMQEQQRYYDTTASGNGYNSIPSQPVEAHQSYHHPNAKTH